MTDIVSIDINKAKILHQKKIEEQRRFAKHSQTLQQKIISSNSKQHDTQKIKKHLTQTQSHIHDHSADIGAGLWQLGKYLHKIKIDRLYIAQKYESFDMYCKIDMSISPTYAHNLILVFELLTIDQSRQYGIKLCVLLAESKTAIRDKILSLIEIGIKCSKPYHKKRKKIRKVKNFND
jgi:hypothetical protein